MSATDIFFFEEIAPLYCGAQDIIADRGLGVVCGLGWPAGGPGAGSGSKFSVRGRKIRPTPTTSSGTPKCHFEPNPTPQRPRFAFLSFSKPRPPNRRQHRQGTMQNSGPPGTPLRQPAWFGVSAIIKRIPALSTVSSSV